VCEIREMRTKFWLESPKRRGLSEDLGVGGKLLLKCVLDN
jgi:hypothetical protein